MNELLLGDCLERMAELKADGVVVDSIVTDPPYGLGFMGRHWDAPENVAFRPETWRLAAELLVPGGVIAAFGGSRTQHRIAVALEDAGLEIRDCVMWLYGTGFPKNKNLLKPAYEPILLARKPGPLRELGIDDCRIATEGERFARPAIYNGKNEGWARPWMSDPEALARSQRAKDEAAAKAETLGRWPANVVHDGSEEVLEAFAAFGERQSRSGARKFNRASIGYGGSDVAFNTAGYGNDTGTAARFFYCAKASKAERAGSAHPTVKPMALMRWLVRLTVPPGGLLLDPFAGTGTTVRAALAEGRRAIGIEREPDYHAEAIARLPSVEAAE